VCVCGGGGGGLAQTMGQRMWVWPPVVHCKLWRGVSCRPRAAPGDHTRCCRHPTEEAGGWRVSACHLLQMPLWVCSVFGASHQPQLRPQRPLFPALPPSLHAHSPTSPTHSVTPLTTHTHTHTHVTNPH
jgi:hypothetical protein